MPLSHAPHYPKIDLKIETGQPVRQPSRLPVPRRQRLRFLGPYKPCNRTPLFPQPPGRAGNNGTQTSGKVQ